MGTKEESLPVRYLFGYAGQLRPLQTIGGNCPVCRQTVWIDYEPTYREYRETVVVHHGCEDKSLHRTNLKPLPEKARKHHG